MAPRIRVGLIGAGILNSKSPLLHMEEARAQGLDLVYDLIDLTARGLGPKALPELVAKAGAEGYAGLNITHPCKQLVLPLLDDLSDDARALGAVNTVVFRDGRRSGHNTDWSGFMQGFRCGLPGLTPGTVLQLGTGGAGAAVAHAWLAMGVERLFLHDIDMTRAGAMAEALNIRAARDVAQAVADPAAAMALAEGVVNCTPMGMAAHPGLPMAAGLIEPRHWVAEIVYFPLETAFLAAARQKGCRVVDGGGMAVFQAVEAFRLFTGQAADPERMRASFLRATAAPPPDAPAP